MADFLTTLISIIWGIPIIFILVIILKIVFSFIKMVISLLLPDKIYKNIDNTLSIIILIIIILISTRVFFQLKGSFSSGSYGSDYKGPQYFDNTTGKFKPLD